jgi:hypothetical protein
MKKLKLLKPWQLPTVRQRLSAADATTSFRNDATLMAPCGDAPARNEFGVDGRTAAFQNCSTPTERSRKLRTPSRGPIFASTVSKHPGCPHLFS